MKKSSTLMNEIDHSISKKVELFQSSLSRYMFRAILACLFLTLGTAIAFGIAIKSEAIAHGLGKMFYGFMFSWSLVMIIYMDAELGTSNMMYMTIGVYRKKVKLSMAVKLLLTCVLLNLIGGVFFGYLMALTGPFQGLASDNYMFTSLTAKLEKSTLQIFVEGMFANIIVNTAVVATMRMKDDAAKVISTVFIIFIFAFLGFEHVIANFPAFTIGYVTSGGTLAGMSVGSVLHNLVFAFLGNYVGGGLIIGLGYAWLNSDQTVYLD